MADIITQGGHSRFLAGKLATMVAISVTEPTCYRCHSHVLLQKMQVRQWSSLVLPSLAPVLLLNTNGLLQPTSLLKYLNFRLISMDGSGLTDLPLRRRVNKLFMECLEDVQHDQAAALIWLKRHIEPEICNTILSDKNFSGIHIIFVSYRSNSKHFYQNVCHHSNM